MLVALQDGVRIEAWVAEKGPAYVCPNCKAPVILRKGRIVAHNFAHKPPVTCSWASGETQAHLKAKKALRDGFAARGHRVEVEAPVLSVAGDRRADVLVYDPTNGRRFSIEVQHQALDFDAIDRRTRAYMAVGVPVVWVALIKAEALAGAETTPAGLVISRYAPRPWEKWAHAYGMGALWFIEPESGQLWRGVMKEHLIEVPYSSWYDSYGNEESAGGYTRHSKKWRELHLTGPHEPAAVMIEPFARSAWSGKAFSLPGGPAAKLAAARPPMAMSG
jgi:competence protein CoiA